MKRAQAGAGPAWVPGARRWLAALFFAILFLAPVKFGNPAAPSQQPVFPWGGWEWLLQPWPSEAILLAAWWLGLGTLVLDAAERRIALPGRTWSFFAAFVVWEIACGVSAGSRPAWVMVLRYHGALLAFWYAAWSLLRGRTGREILAGALAGGVLCVAVVALQQRWGGIEATRRYAEEVFGPGNIPERLRSKLASSRVWGTFVYPNALAGFPGPELR